jgi:uncharacterized membrane protein
MSLTLAMLLLNEGSNPVPALFGGLGLLFWLAVVVICIVNAYQGKRFKLPIIGNLAEKQAGA